MTNGVAAAVVLSDLDVALTFLKGMRDDPSWCDSANAEQTACHAAAYFAAFPEIALIIPPADLAQAAVEARQHLGQAARVAALDVAETIWPNGPYLQALIMEGGVHLTLEKYTSLLQRWLEARPSSAAINQLLRCLAVINDGKRLPRILGLIVAQLETGPSLASLAVGELVRAAQVEEPPDLALRRGTALIAARRLVDGHLRGRPQLARSLEAEQFANMIGRTRDAIIKQALVPSQATVRSPFQEGYASWTQFKLGSGTGEIRAIHLRTPYAACEVASGTLYAESHPANYFCYGPYVHVPAGQYKIAFIGHTDSPLGVDFSIECFGEQSPLVLGKQFVVVEASSTPTGMIELGISLDRAAVLETKIYVHSRNGMLRLSAIRFNRMTSTARK